MNMFRDNITIYEVYDKIHSCTLCKDLMLLEANKTKFNFGGSKDAKYMWVAQNPGYVVDKKVNHVFPIKNNNNIRQDEFTVFLNNIGMYSKSYFTNIIKCSTKNNKEPTDKNVVNCIKYLMAEINIINPDKIITLGRFSNKIFNKIKANIYNKQIINLYHPTYVYTYNRSMITQFQNKIKEIYEST